MASRLRPVTLANLKPAPGSHHSVSTTASALSTIADLTLCSKNVSGEVRPPAMDVPQDEVQMVKSPGLDLA